MLNVWVLLGLSAMSVCSFTCVPLNQYLREADSKLGTVTQLAGPPVYGVYEWDFHITFTKGS